MQAEQIDALVVDLRLRRRAIAADMIQRCQQAAPRCHCGGLLHTDHEPDGFAWVACEHGHIYRSAPMNPVVWCAHCRKHHPLDQLVNRRRQVWREAEIVFVGECPVPVPEGATRGTLSLPLGAYGV